MQEVLRYGVVRPRAVPEPAVVVVLVEASESLAAEFAERGHDADLREFTRRELARLVPADKVLAIQDLGRVSLDLGRRMKQIQPSDAEVEVPHDDDEVDEPHDEDEVDEPHDDDASTRSAEVDALVGTSEWDAAVAAIEQLEASSGLEVDALVSLAKDSVYGEFYYSASLESSVRLTAAVNLLAGLEAVRHRDEGGYVGLRIGPPLEDRPKLSQAAVAAALGVLAAATEERLTAQILAEMSEPVLHFLTAERHLGIGATIDAAISALVSVSGVSSVSLASTMSFDPVTNPPETLPAAQAGSTVAVHPASGDWDSLSQVPTTMGKARYLGEGFPRVVRTERTGYVLDEIAHIENILAKEERVRLLENTDERTFETEFIEESEVEEFVDNQSTERFSLDRELEVVQNDSTTFSGNIAISAEYGPWLSVTAEAGATTTSDLQISESEAASFESEQINRATKRLRNRVEERRAETVRSSRFERNSHTLTGTEELQSVSYQFVDKFYELQTYELPQRTLYELLLPEPGAFLLSVAARAQGVAAELPDAFVATPASITEDNAAYFTALYNAQGVKPPPPETVTVATSIETRPGKQTPREQEEARVVHGVVDVPDGYRAVSARFELNQASLVGGDASPDEQLWISVAQHERYALEGLVSTAYFDLTSAGDASWTIGTNQVPYTVVTTHFWAAAFTLEVRCDRTEEAMAEWRFETHEALRLAYANALDEARREAQDRPAPHLAGLRSLLADDLKRASIASITGQNFAGFGAVQTEPDGFEMQDFGVPRSQQEFALFFEQAFEWANMASVPYPYYWGRRSTWARRIEQMQTLDEPARSYLSAGVIRVVLPVRRGFEQLVASYFKTGTVWAGGLPPLDDEAWVDPASELRGPDLGKPIKKPWVVRIPTTLVRATADWPVVVEPTPPPSTGGQ